MTTTDRLLLETLAAEDFAEEYQGLHGDDRLTCWTHRSWFQDCRHLPLHPQDIDPIVTGHR